jgi:translation initiation factor IF-2
MMSVLEYALDVNKTSEEIINLCKKLQISVTDENSILKDEDIIMLDNEINSFDDEDNYDEEELDEKVERIVEEANIDVDNHVRKEKLKSKVELKNESRENFLKGKKEIYKHREKLMTNVEKDENIILYKNNMTVGELANILNVNAVELIKKLMSLGIMANINQALSFEDVELLLLDYNKVLKKEENADISNFENYEILDSEENLVSRAPVVTIMGHVDHGKTTLLDTIRKTNVALGEAGGITQAIGAYQVEVKGRPITFIDTPGHAAFTEMRARGASVTDIVIIIVAADDGIMPQTKEAIDHAKAANVPIIVAINKIDKVNGGLDRIYSDLAENGLTPEEWGGDTIVAKISAKTGLGVDELLETINLVAEMKNLRANPNRYANGTVIEARLDKQIGAVVTVLIQNGTLRLGDPIVIGNSYGKVRSLKNDLGQDITSAAPSTPVEITGINELPRAGDKFMAFETEKQARSISEERKRRTKLKDCSQVSMSLEELFTKIQCGIKEVNVVLKTDVKGSEEAVKHSLEKIDIDGIKVRVIRSGVGTISESDVVLANASQAIIIGFNVRPNAKTVEFAKEYNVDIKLYNIIYQVIEDMENAIRGMLDPEYVENVTGQAEIRKIFKFSKVGNIAGCHVLSGIIKINSQARIVRDGIIIYDGKISTIQREKDQAKEAKAGLDCGITLDNYQDIKENDIIETYEMVLVKK